MSVWVKEIHNYLTYVVKEEQDPRYIGGEAYMLMCTNTLGPIHLVILNPNPDLNCDPNPAPPCR